MRVCAQGEGKIKDGQIDAERTILRLSVRKPFKPFGAYLRATAINNVCFFRRAKRK